MKDWILGVIVKWLLGMITSGTIEAVADKIKALVIPFIRSYKQDLFTRLKAEAAATSTPLDDAWIAWLDALLDAFLPDNPKTLADLPARPDTPMVA